MIDKKDDELIKRFVGGEERAFNEIVGIYQKRLYYGIRRYIKQHDDADEVLQNVFIKIYKGLKNFKGDSSLFTWMFRIAINESFTFLKIKKVREFVSIDDAIEVEDKSDAPNEVLEKNEMRIKLENVIEKLPEKQKKVFMMRYYDELSFNEISAILNTSVGGLKANYFHAIKKIGEYLKNEM